MSTRAHSASEAESLDWVGDTGIQLAVRVKEARGIEGFRILVTRFVMQYCPKVVCKKRASRTKTGRNLDIPRIPDHYRPSRDEMAVIGVVDCGPVWNRCVRYCEYKYRGYGRVKVEGYLRVLVAAI